MFALEDLYNGAQGITKVAPQATNSVNNSNIFNTFLRDFNVSYWAVELNQWLLAFTVFYSFWFLMDFLFFKIIHHEGEIENEDHGLKSLAHLNKMWLSYFIYLAIWSVAIFNAGIIRTVFEYFSLLVGFVVLVGVDLPMIPVIGVIFGGASSSAGNIFTQIWGKVFGIFTMFSQYFLEAVGIVDPPVKKEKP